MQRNRSEFREQVRRRTYGGAKISEMQALVLPVRITERIFQAEQEGRGTAEFVRERAHEGNRAPAPDEHSLPAEARGFGARVLWTLHDFYALCPQGGGPQGPTAPCEASWSMGQGASELGSAAARSVPAPFPCCSR